MILHFRKCFRWKNLEHQVEVKVIHILSPSEKSRASFDTFISIFKTFCKKEVVTSYILYPLSSKFLSVTEYLRVLQRWLCYRIRSISPGQWSSQDKTWISCMHYDIFTCSGFYVYLSAFTGIFFNNFPSDLFLRTSWWNTERSI